MSVSNAVYDFAEQIVAASTGELSGSLVQTDLYEKLGDAKTIRVGDVQQAIFAPGIDDTLVESNAYLTIQFVSKPASQRTEDLKTARLQTVNMAKEFAFAVLMNSGLNRTDDTARVCDCQIVRYLGDQKKDVSTAKMPVAFIQLLINAR